MAKGYFFRSNGRYRATRTTCDNLPENQGWFDIFETTTKTNTVKFCADLPLAKLQRRVEYQSVLNRSCIKATVATGKNRCAYTHSYREARLRCRAILAPRIAATSADPSPALEGCDQTRAHTDEWLAQDRRDRQDLGAITEDDRKS
jgi:hypothetical protein